MYEGGCALFLFLQDGVLDTSELSARFVPVLADVGLECLGVEWGGDGHRGTLRVYIEAAGREVDLDDCERASHALSAFLDTEDPIAGAYVLEVSSPGIDRPIFTAGQFARHLGAEVRVTLKLPIQGRRRFRGRIHSVASARITIDAEGTTTEFDIADVEAARLVPDWSALGLAPQPKPGAGSGRGGKRAGPTKAKSKQSSKSTQHS